MGSPPFREKMLSSPPCTFNVLPDVMHKHRGRHPLTVMLVRQPLLVLLEQHVQSMLHVEPMLRQRIETPRFWGVSVSGFRLVLGALLGHLGAFLALRLSGDLRRRSYLLLARHLSFSPVSRRGLSGRWHDALLLFRAVMALSTIGGALARIKGRKQRCEASGNSNGGRAGGNAHGAATAGMTYHGDPVSGPLDTMNGEMKNGTSGYGGVSDSTSASGSLSPSGLATCGHLPRCNADIGH
ncbi:hypothetical protein [Paraburkholderia terrae]|uniref:hypothetical protein n=1 Tax=Paraburkholderia terrae TaxID=311230 RepID=UPI001E2C1DB5|nr:hypothetical protein [Paraburkholderia terrae]